MSGEYWQDSNRPTSRRGDGGSPALSRPPPSGRVGTATRLANIGSGMPMKTGSRMSTAMGRAPQSILDRPITQHGISGLTTSAGGGGMSRQIQDRRYWEGVLQIKMRELQDEVMRLQGISETAAREQSARRHYDRKVKQIATELTELQGRLSDYNMVMEKISSGTNRNQIDSESKVLRDQNDDIQATLEKLFEQRQKADEQVHQLEKEIATENKNINLLVNAMPDHDRATYMHLQSTAAELQSQANTLQNQLENVAKEREHLHVQITGSQTRQDAVRLLQRLREAEARKSKLQIEQSNKLTPTQEREKLLLQVREDNSAVASLDRQTNVLKEEIKKKKQLLEQAEQDLEEGRSDRHQKYIELRRRDEAIEEYLQGFPNAYVQESNRLVSLEATALYCLEHSSLGVTGGDMTDQPILDKKLDTDEGLSQEHKLLSINLKKVEALENKMREELTSLQDSELNLRQELVVVTDLKQLREKHSERVQQLLKEKESLSKKKLPTKNAVEEAQRKYDELKTKLEGNEMYTRLKSMEDKLTKLDETITELQKNVKTASTSASFQEIQNGCLNALEKYNNMLNASISSS